MLEGKIQEATRFLTERETNAYGGVLSPDDDAGKQKGKTVMKVLQSKHPEQATPGEEAFVECPNLPDLFLFIYFFFSSIIIIILKFYTKCSANKRTNLHNLANFKH